MSYKGATRKSLDMYCNQYSHISPLTSFVKEENCTLCEKVLGCPWTSTVFTEGQEIERVPLEAFDESSISVGLKYATREWPPSGINNCQAPGHTL